jgi:predicted transcriptional regulator
VLAPSIAAQRKFLTINPQDDVGLVKGLSSPMRLQILQVLRRIGPMNVNQISRHLSLPQSTIATNIQALETAGLIQTERVKAAKGQQ